MSNIYITQMLVPPSKYSIKCPFPMDWQEICVHNTANRASAMAEASYMVGHNMQISWHYAVDDYRAVQCLPLNRNGWHAGDGGNGRGNRKSLGIEICYSIDKGDKRYPVAQANAAILIARLLKSKNFGTNRIKIHRDYSGKYCPHRMLDNGHWDAFFKAQVQAILDKLNGVVTPPKSTTSIKAGDVVRVTGTKYATGQTVPNWVKNTSHKVYKVSGESALLGHPGGINSWLYLKDLTVVTPPKSTTSIKAGDVVRVTGTKYATGQTVPNWVKNTSHKVYKVSGESALLGHPGGINSWLYLKDLTKAESVPKTFKSYLVRIRISNLYIRAEAGTNSAKRGFIKPGVYTIVEEKTGQGAKLWGKLKSGAGWIALDFVEKL